MDYRKIYREIGTAIVGHPMEMLLAAAFFLIGCCAEWVPQDRSWDLFNVLRYGVGLFVLTYLLHTLKERTWAKVGYYLSPLLAVVVCFIHDDCPGRIGITLLLVQLLYLWCIGEKENRAFTRTAVHYVEAMAVSFALGTVVCIALLLITSSVYYIFELQSSVYARLIEISAATGYGLAMPLLFLVFDRQKEMLRGDGKVAHYLLNYILSPALLAYTFILYLYMAKIAVSASLPKGGVAAMVMGFVSLLFILRSLQGFLAKTYYRWYYCRASWIALPTLALAWWGTMYRIGEYGWTVMRVYLVVALCTLTFMAVLFLFRRYGRYRTVVLFALLSFGIFSYMPGINVEEIERWSQAGREQTGKEETKDYLSIHPTARPIDLSRYNRMTFIREYTVEHDSLHVYRDSTLLYGNSLPNLLLSQMQKVGLSPGDTIRIRDFNRMLLIEMDSSAIFLDYMNLIREDGRYRITYTKPGIYLEDE